MRIFFSAVLVVTSGFMLVQCSPTPSTIPAAPEYSKADSVTEQYLSLQDSLHSIWNVMIKHDNEKIQAMRNLVHELSVSKPENKDHLTALGERLDQLLRSRYTQKSLANEDVIEEYDFATKSIANELLTTTSNTTEYSYNKTLQALVRSIHEAEERTYFHRQEYDSIAKIFNVFVEKNQELLLQMEEGMTIEKKPYFYMVAEE